MAFDEASGKEAAVDAMSNPSPGAAPVTAPVPVLGHPTDTVPTDTGFVAAIPEGSAPPADATQPAEPNSVFSPEYRWISIGMCALVLLAAFESLAVTTVMPTISADLNGASLYALAFAGPLAIGVVGMVGAGNWADRRGARSALYGSSMLFVLGLLVAGTATNMWVFVIGRLIHGIGGGGSIVALYVIVARVYPTRLQAKIFAGFAAAWVVPSLVGPALAGLVAQQFGWHWVFLGVIALVFPALVMVVPAMRSLTHEASDSAVPWEIGRIIWSFVAACAVMGLNLGAELEGAWRWIVSGAGIVVTIVALRPLLPRRTLIAGRGLPSVILLRGLAGTAFFGAEVYLPYLLIDGYGLEPAVAGLALTSGGVFWALGSWAQGRTSDRVSSLVCFRVGTILVAISLFATLAMNVFELSPWVAFVAWAGAGAGMGTMYPRLSVVTLSLSTRQTQGFNSAALTISDAMGAAIALAVSAYVFSWLAPLGTTWSFAGCFALAAVVAVIALGLAHRIRISSE